MRKIIVAVAIIAGAIYGYSKLTGTGADIAQHQQLDFVPADTAFLSAQLEPIDFVAYLNSFGMSANYYNDASQQQLTELLTATDNPQLRFVLSLAKQYMQALSEPTQLTALTGIKPQMRSLSYLVGLSPVMRIELADEAAFWQVFDRAEQASSLSYQPMQSDVGAYRSYSFSVGEYSAKLLVSVTDGWGNLALVLPTQTEQSRQLVLLAAKPERSINTDNQLAKLAADYKLNPNAIGFVSFQQLVTGLTTENGNRLATDLQQLASPQFSAAMEPWRTVDCQQDLASITNSWPGIYLDSRVSSKPGQKTEFRSKMLVPTHNKETVSTLSSIRGFIPQHMLQSNNDAIFHYGTGVDMAEFAPAVTKIWRGLTQPVYQCPQLGQLQQQLQQANPMALLAAGAMVHSVQGASITVNDLALDSDTMQLSTVDAMLSVTVKNARSYLEGVKGMVPGMAEITLPADGQELALNSVLPMLDAFGVTPLLQVNDSHLVIYMGEKGTTQATAVLQQAIEKNGLLSFGMDYPRFFGLMTQAMKASGQPVPAELGSLTDVNMQFNINMDIDKQGVVIHSQMAMGSGN